MVKPEIEPERVLLLASDATFESEVRAALERQHGSSVFFLYLVYLDVASKNFRGPRFTRVC